MGFFSNIGFGSFLPIIGNGIDAAIGHYESNRQMHFQEDTMREQMAWQEKMNAQQQEWQEGMWNRTNEYNTPSAQLGRMVAAGINPNNAAMQVAGGSNNAQMAQQPQTPSAPGGLNGAMPSPTNFGQGARDAALIDSEIKLKEDQGKAALMQGEAALRNAGVNEGQLHLNEKQLNKVLSVMSSQIDNIEADTKLKLKQVDLQDVQIESLKLENIAKDVYNRELLPLIKAGKIEEINNLKKDLQVKDTQMKEAFARIRQANQSIEESKERIKVLRKQADNIQADTDLKKTQNEIANAEKTIKEAEATIASIKADQAGRVGVNWYEFKNLWDIPTGALLQLESFVNYTFGKLSTLCDDAVEQLGKYGSRTAGAIGSVGSYANFGVNGSTVNPRY